MDRLNEIKIRAEKAKNSTTLMNNPDFYVFVLNYLEDVPWLLAEVERLQREVETLRDNHTIKAAMCAVPYMEEAEKLMEENERLEEKNQRLIDENVKLANYNAHLDLLLNWLRLASSCPQEKIELCEKVEGLTAESARLRARMEAAEEALEDARWEMESWEWKRTSHGAS